MEKSSFNEYVIEPVLSSIQKYKDRNAFCISERFYTYEQFGQNISKIRKGIVSETFENTNVGLVINDDIETYASIFALWLEGFSYVPLHPQWPAERCDEIINQVNLDLILDSSEKSRYTSGGGV